MDEARARPSRARPCAGGGFRCSTPQVAAGFVPEGKVNRCLVSPSMLGGILFVLKGLQSVTSHIATTNPRSVTLYRKDGRKKRGPPPRHSLKCKSCRSVFFHSTYGRKHTYCDTCRVAYQKAQKRAGRAVTRAVARGLMPPARDLECVDCAERWQYRRKAVHYDHRSYKPADLLKVEPVCAMHNFARGRAIWVKNARPNLPPSSAILRPCLSSAYRTEDDVSVGEGR